MTVPGIGEGTTLDGKFVVVGFFSGVVIIELGFKVGLAETEAGTVAGYVDSL